MAASEYDLVIAGGGPAGSATAWRAASNGARVLVLDKATFPRDKACGDGITPRAVKWLGEMGLGDEVARRFHRVDGYRLIVKDRVVERPWPGGPFGLPDHAYVASRVEFDAMLLQHAAEAGAEVREGCTVTEPIVEDGVACGLRYRTDGKLHDVRGRIVVAADGMSSRVGRALGMVPLANHPFAIAARAQVEADIDDDSVLSVYYDLTHEGKVIPGYAWVFPMGGGLINIGAGYASSYRRYRELNVNDLMREFVSRLPAAWGVPSVESLLETRRLKGWRLPMGLCVWPPWRPGALAVGDAAGMIKPFTGAGISKALEGGIVAADAALLAIDGPTGPTDLSHYAARLDALWGTHYRLGRAFARAIGTSVGMRTLVWGPMRVAPTATAFTRVASNLYRERGGGVMDRAMRVGMRAVAVVRNGDRGDVRPARFPNAAARARGTGNQDAGGAAGAGDRSKAALQ